MVSTEPLSIERMRSVFEEPMPTEEAILVVLNELGSEYATRALELHRLPHGYLIRTQASVAPWITRLWDEKPEKYSQALFEVLAIIAYRQPVTRGDIEDIRGVSLHRSMMKTLLERGWIRVLGHRDVPGKPLEYVTTTDFLDHFNLASLKNLPTLDVQEHEQ